jgi:hypothetical protein
MMAQKQELGPTDVAAAVIDGGKLLIIDGRGMPWTFEGGQKDAAGKEIEGPTGAEAAFVINERLHVIAGGVVWTYYPGSTGWVEGFELDTKAEESEEHKGPWTKGRSVESRAAVPDELRRAQATLDAAEASEEAASEGKPSRKKAKEHA